MAEAEFITTSAGSKIHRSSTALLRGTDRIHLGPKSVVGRHVEICGDLGHHIYIGKACVLDGCVLKPEDESLAIGDYVAIGRGSTVRAKALGRLVLVGRDVVIARGVVIKDCCVVADGAVVVENSTFPPFSVCQGNPAVNI
jgi:dynactin-5